MADGKVDVHLLREYAGQALIGLVIANTDGDSPLAWKPASVARASYDYAQAMVEEDERLSRERIRAERKEARNG